MCEGGNDETPRVESDCGSFAEREDFVGSCDGLVRRVHPSCNAGIMRLTHAEAGKIKKVARMGNPPAEEEECGIQANAHEGTSE